MKVKKGKKGRKSTTKKQQNVASENTRYQEAEAIEENDQNNTKSVNNKVETPSKKGAKKSSRAEEKNSLAEKDESNAKNDSEIKINLSRGRESLKKNESKSDHNSDESDEESNPLEGQKKSLKRTSTAKGSETKKSKTSEESDEEEATEEYEVEKLVDVYLKKNGEKEFLVRWKGYLPKDDTWEPEKHLNCKELIDAFMKKCEKAKSIPARETRVQRRPTDRFVMNSNEKGRKLSRRFQNKPRKTYYEL